MGLARGQVGALHLGAALAAGAHARVPRQVEHAARADRGRVAAPARGHAALQQRARDVPDHAARRGVHAHRLQPHPLRAQRAGGAARRPGRPLKGVAVDGRVARVRRGSRRRGPRGPKARGPRGGEPKGGGAAAQGPGAARDHAGGHRGHGRGRPDRALLAAAAADAAARAGARARLRADGLLWRDPRAAAEQLHEALPALLAAQPLPVGL